MKLNINFIKNLSLLLFGLWSQVSMSQIYKGFIGSYPIYMNIAKYGDDNLECSYFYDKQLININLQGERTAAGYRFYEKYSNIEDKKELFILQKDGDKLVGQWFNKQLLLNVELKEVDIDLNTYKKKRLKLQKDRVEKFGQLELVWFKEKYSDIELFRLGNGFSAKQRQFLNKKLDSIHEQNALMFLDCGKQFVQFTPRFVSKHILSFTEAYNIYCGGAYPSHGEQAFNLDLNKLTALDKLNELFPSLDYVQLIKNKYQTNKTLDGECGYFDSSNSSIWTYCNWYLKDDKLLVAPSFPHAMAPCVYDFELLFSEIENLPSILSSHVNQ